MSKDQEFGVMQWINPDKKRHRYYALFVFLAALCVNHMTQAQAQNSLRQVKDASDFLEEVSVPNTDKDKSLKALYAAYSCAYHHQYDNALRWIDEAKFKDAGSILRARDDKTYLVKSLNIVAAQQKQQAISQSSCELAITHALLNIQLGIPTQGLSKLKRIAVDNPKYSNIYYLQSLIKTKEFELSDHSWATPPDVLQIGGGSNKFCRWRSDRLPLKVFIPSDSASSKTPGYKLGDAIILRKAFDLWQSTSKKQVSFVFVQTAKQADIICKWASKKSELNYPDPNAVGVCRRTATDKNCLISAEIRILNLIPQEILQAKSDANLRTSYLTEISVHEIGHSLGLNHSPNRADIMYPTTQPVPITSPSVNDLTALESRYRTNIYDFINASTDASYNKQYNLALTNLEKAFTLSEGDKITSEIVCSHLLLLAEECGRAQEFSTALKSYQKARPLAEKSASQQTKVAMLKGLRYTLIKTKHEKEAAELECANKDIFKTENSASFLDQYGMNEQAIPFYQKALEQSPEDNAIRDKYCTLLLTLARDAVENKEDISAIGFFKQAMSLSSKDYRCADDRTVMSELRDTYLRTEQYELADKLQWLMHHRND